MGGLCSGGFASGAARVETEEALRDVYASLNTGDILLFQSTGAVPLFTRFSAGEWDHVAVIIRRRASDGPRVGPVPQQKIPASHKCAQSYCTCVAEPEDLVEMLESTAAGVHIYGMDDRLAKTVNHHTHIAVLKRNVPVTDEQRNQLEAYALKVRGRGYERLLSGDLCHAAFANLTWAFCGDDADGHSGGQEWVDGQQEAMFCSELAACALGSIGTLKLAGFHGTPTNEGHEARSFLPTDFCDETGGSRQIWLDCVHAAGCDDPYAPLMMLQYPGGPYTAFLRGLKKQLRQDWKDAGGAAGTGVVTHHRNLTQNYGTLEPRRRTGLKSGKAEQAAPLLGGT